MGISPEDSALIKDLINDTKAIGNNLIKSKCINANSHMGSNNEIWNICTKFW